MKDKSLHKTDFFDINGVIYRDKAINSELYLLSFKAFVCESDRVRTELTQTFILAS